MHLRHGGPSLVKLPDCTDSGLPRLGIHQADLPGIYESLVLDAPHRNLCTLSGALSRHLKLVQPIVAVGLIWIGGSFCARGTKSPCGVDVVMRSADIAALRSRRAWGGGYSVALPCRALALCHGRSWAAWWRLYSRAAGDLAGRRLTSRTCGSTLGPRAALRPCTRRSSIVSGRSIRVSLLCTIRS